MRPAHRHRKTPTSVSTPASHPRAGLMQADVQGQVWLCEAVMRNNEVIDYYLVRLSRLDGGEPVGQPVVLSPSEYVAFSQARGLQPVLL